MAPTVSGSRQLRIAAVIAAALLLNTAFASVVRAEWKTWGVELCTAFDTQNAPQLVSDGAGGAIVTWVDKRTGETDIYAQRVSADGTPLWSHDGVPVCTDPGAQRQPMLIADGQGGAIIAWKDERSGTSADVYAQRIDANGQALWTAQGVVVSEEAWNQADPLIVSDGADGAIIAWRDWRNGATPRYYVQRLNGAGTKLWNATGVLVSTTGNDYDGALLPDGAGGALIAWFAWRNSQFDVFAQHVTAQGAPAWTQPGLAVCAATGNQVYPRLTSDGAGGAIVGWYDYRSGASYDIYAQRFTAGGTLAPGWPVNGLAVCTAANDQAEPALAPDGDHGALITWYDNRSTVAIYAQHVTGAGQIPAGWPVNGEKLCQSPATRPTIMPDGTGGALVAWHGTPGNTNLDVSVQRVEGNGEIPPGWPSDGIYLCTAPGDQSRPVGIPLPGGDALIAWSDGRSADGGDIYISRVTLAFPNLNADLAPAGFEYPLVPRNAPGATVSNAVLTPVLDGDVPTTLLNWAVTREGSGTLPAWNCRVDLDGAPLRVTTLSAASAGNVYSVVDDGPVAVPGGRHTLSLEVDYDNVVSESSESDNIWRGQFVWSPRPLSSGAGLYAAPPEKGTGALPNLDGFELTPTTGAAWVCALAPVNGSDDYDLALFDDYAGSLSGFTHEIAGSARPGAAVEFVVGQGSGAPATLYPAALRASAAAGGDYAIDRSDAAGRHSPAGQSQWVRQVMAAHRLADVYEGEFAAGVTYYVNLVQQGGPSDMAFSIFPAGANQVFAPGQALVSSRNLTPDGGQVDVVQFTPEESGTYPIVVYRTHGGAGIDEPLTYEFFWSNMVSGVEDGGRAPAFEFAGASPNPTRGPTDLSFAVPVGATARIDLFDVTGRLVRSLLNGEVAAGSHEVAWDGRTQDGGRAGSGIYWARFESGGQVVTRRIVVAR